MADLPARHSRAIPPRTTWAYPGGEGRDERGAAEKHARVLPMVFMVISCLTHVSSGSLLSLVSVRQADHDGNQNKPLCRTALFRRLMARPD